MVLAAIYDHCQDALFHYGLQNGEFQFYDFFILTECLPLNRFHREEQDKFLSLIFATFQIVLVL